MNKSEKVTYKNRTFSYRYSGNENSPDEVLAVHVYEIDEFGYEKKRKRRFSSKTVPDSRYLSEDAKKNIALQQIQKYYAKEIQHVDMEVLATYYQGSFLSYVRDTTNVDKLMQIRALNLSEKSTAHSYKRALTNQWGDAFDNDIPFYKLTNKDCLNAKERILEKMGTPSPDREEWLLNVLRQLMNYAVSVGHIESSPVPEPQKANLTEETKRMVGERRMNRNTLDGEEIRLLFEEIKKNYLADGTWLAIGRMLLTGVRTGEACGALFADFIEFSEYKDEYYIRVMRQQRSAKVNDIKLKTPNAYRCTGIIHEFAELILNKRRQVEANLTEDDDIDLYPIACYGTKYSKPCLPDQVNTLLSKWLESRKIRFDRRAMNTVIESEEDDDIGKYPTAYMLRRTAYTFMKSVAALNDEETSYLIGHSFTNNDRGGVAKHYRDFASEDRIHDMLHKLNRIAYWCKIKENDNEQIEIGESGKVLQLHDKDTVTASATLNKGEHLQIVVQAHEANNPIDIEVSADKDIILEKTSYAGLGEGKRDVVTFSGLRDSARERVKKEREYKKKATEELTFKPAPPRPPVVPGEDHGPANKVCEEDEYIGLKDFVVITENACANRVPIAALPAQGHRGTGRFVVRVKRDEIAAAVMVRPDSKLLVINANGDAAIVQTNDIDERSLQSKALRIKSFPIPPEECKIVAAVMVPQSWEDDSSYLFLASDGGAIKNMAWRSLEQLILGNEIIANIGFPVSGGQVAAAFSWTYNPKVNRLAMLLTDKGHILCLKLNAVIDEYGEVIGIGLNNGERCVDAVMYKDQRGIATVTEAGFGKLSDIHGLRISDTKKMDRWHQPGGYGVIAHKYMDEKGPLVKCCPVNFEDEDIILISSLGKAIRLSRDSEIHVSGMNNSGSRFQKIEHGSKASKMYGSICCLLRCKHDEEE